MFSLCLLYAFLKLVTVFDLFITSGTMFSGHHCQPAGPGEVRSSGSAAHARVRTAQKHQVCSFIPFIFCTQCCGSGSISLCFWASWIRILLSQQRYGSFYHQAKNSLPLFDLISLKNNVNVPSKRNKQKNLEKISFLLAF